MSFPVDVTPLVTKTLTFVWEGVDLANRLLCKRRNTEGFTSGLERESTITLATKIGVNNMKSETDLRYHEMTLFYPLLHTP